MAAGLGACNGVTPAPAKNRDWLKARLLGTRDDFLRAAQTPRSASDSLDAPYEARWYRVNGLSAGDEITVTLQMPAGEDVDYTLLGYTDLRQMAERLLPTSGSVDADDMDSDDMDSDDMDSDDMDSDDMDSDDMDSDDMDSDDMDSDDMDSDDMDSGDSNDDERNRYRDVYSRAQRHALRASSITAGPAPEQIRMIARADGGDLYFRVRGHLSASSRTPFTIQAIVIADHSCDTPGAEPAAAPALTCTPSSIGPAPTGGAVGKHALIITHTGRASLGLTDCDKRDAFLKKLDELATAVNGVVYDFAREDGLRPLYQAWDGAIKCVPVANDLAEAIRKLLAPLMFTDKSTIRYLVIAGGDDVVPFARIEDRAEIAREWAWAGPYSGDRPLGATLTYGTYLSDDPYGRRSGPADLRGKSVRAPTIAVGRLVETWTDIRDHLIWALGPSGTQLRSISITTALVTGYDFVVDLAKELERTLVSPTLRVDTIISNDWTASDLAAKLLPPAGTNPYQLVAAQGHYSGNTLRPASIDSSKSSKLRPTDRAIQGNDLRGVLWMTIGCHSGHDILDRDTRENLDLDRKLSWAEVLLAKGATLIGGTAYQYGESELLKNSELLYLYLAQEIASTKERPIGDALLAAKRRYLEQGFQTRGMDQKIIEVATIYGLPMLKVGVTTPRPLPTDPPKVEELKRVPISPLVLQRFITVKNYDLTTLVNSDAGSYWPGEQPLVRPLHPVLPGVFRDIALKDTASNELYPMGVIWESGSFSDVQQRTPHISRPVTEQSLALGRRPKYKSRAFLPARPFRIARGGTSIATQSRRYTLVFAPLQLNTSEGRARKWSEATFRVCYAAKGLAADRSALLDAPKLQDAQVQDIGGGQLVASVVVRHHESAGELVEAYASYVDPARGKLVTVPLTGALSSPVGATWRRGFSGKLVGAPANALVFFQAMGGNGRVSALTNGGRFFPAERSSARRTKLTLDVVDSAAYRDRITVGAKLTYFDTGAGVDGDVVFRLGAWRTWVHASGGVADVSLTVAARPSDAARLLVASFPGDRNARGVAAFKTLTVRKATTTLTVRDPIVMASAGRTLLGSLKALDLKGRSGGEVSLGDRAIVVRRKSLPTDVVYVIYTDPDGSFWLEPSDVGMRASSSEILTFSFEGDARYVASASLSRGASVPRVP